MALLFVLLVSGVKAIAEDLKRHNQDDVTNNSPTIVVEEDGKQPLSFSLNESKSFSGTERSVKWKDIKVGDVVRVKDDELFPADILCLKTGLRDKVCFIRTTNLDGESNLKIRKPIDIEAALQGRNYQAKFAEDDTIPEEASIDASGEEASLFENNRSKRCLFRVISSDTAFA